MKKKFIAITTAVALLVSGAIYFAPQQVAATEKMDEGTELTKVCFNHYSSGYKAYSDESTLKSPATCTSKAEYYYKCSSCGQTITTQTYFWGSKLPHDYSCEEEMNRDERYCKQAATYDTPAVYYKTCINCDAVNFKETYEWGDPLIRYGDANNDGSIDTRDISLIARYLANYDDDTETSTISLAKASAADANGDGSIDTRDISLIARYLANYDDDTETSSIALGPKE